MDVAQPRKRGAQVEFIPVGSGPEKYTKDVMVEGEKDPQHMIYLFKYYHLAAEEDIDAQYSLARCYQHGLGAMRDERKAVYYFNMAATQGHIDAQFEMGLRCLKGKDFSSALRFFHAAAEQGHRTAQCNLGTMYLNAVGVPRDPRLAVQFFASAAGAGWPEAQFNLGRCYAEGIGVEEDEHLSLKYLNLAAAQGHESARFHLGM